MAREAALMSPPAWLDDTAAARFATLASGMCDAASRLPRDWPKEYRPAPLAGWSDHQEKGELDDV